MLTKIEQSIKEMGVLAILRKKVVQGSVNVYQIDFLGSDDYYHSLLIMYDSVFIYGFDENLLGESNYSCIPSLEKNHRKFTNKAAWIEGRFDDISAKSVDNFINSLKIKTAEVTVGDFSLINLRYGYNPMMLIVFFKYKGIQQRSLVLIPGQEVACDRLYPENSKDFYDFLCKIGVDRYVRFYRSMEVFV